MNKIRQAIKATKDYMEKEFGGVDQYFKNIRILESLQGKIDLANPKEELHKFDELVQMLCKSLDQYFEKIQNSLTDTLSTLNSGISVAGGINTDGSNAQQLADLERQNAELTELIRQRQSEIDREREKFQQLAETIKTNDVEAVRQFADKIDETSSRTVRIRTQISNAREEMIRLIEAGQMGTPEFAQIAENAGKMQKEMAFANATMQYFANPNKGLTTLKVGLQGVAGAAGLASGVVGLFTDDTKKMAEIQAKVSSVLGIIVGLETTYAMVKKSSTLMLAIEEVKTWALAKARGVQATATTAATAAQVGLNAAMKSNPLGAIISLLAVLGTAIYAVTKALFTETDAEKKAREEKEAHVKAI